MAGRDPAPADLFVVGANHRSSPVELRDRLFVEESDAASVYERLRAAGVEQAVILSTCDRVEVLGVAPDPGAAAERVLACLVERSGLAPAEVERAAYRHYGVDALRHVFSVAASLDSQVVGEAQILGQVKAGHRLAEGAGMVGPDLERVLQGAYAAAKRVRTETEIGQRPVSMAAVALDVARDVHGDLTRCRGLLIGGGEMGEVFAERLLAAGLARLEVRHPVLSRAEVMARRLGCHHGDLGDLAMALGDADIVVSALSDGRTRIGTENVEQALRRRRRPMFLIDAAVPPDIDPAVNRIDDAFLYDLHDLETLAEAGRAGRADAAVAARRLLDEEIESFVAARRFRDAAPALVALRDHFEAARAEVMAGDPTDPAEATRRLVNRLLHEPSVMLRETIADRHEMAAMALRLFGLAGRTNKKDGPDE